MNQAANLTDITRQLAAKPKWHFEHVKTNTMTCNSSSANYIKNCSGGPTVPFCGHQSPFAPPETKQPTYDAIIM